MSNEEAIKTLEFFLKEDKTTKFLRRLNNEAVEENKILITKCITALKLQDEYIMNLKKAYRRGITVGQLMKGE